MTFEYIIHRPFNPPAEEFPSKLIVIQCPGWGLGSRYLEIGLEELWNPKTQVGENTPTAYLALFFHPRGTGGSTRPQNSMQMATMPNMACDLEDLRLYLGLDRFDVLIGHSNGAAIALGFAEMYPTRVAQLILISTQVIGVDARQLDQLEVMRGCPEFRDALDILSHPRLRDDAQFSEFVQGVWPLYFYNPNQYVGELLRAIGNRRMQAWCYRTQKECDQQPGRQNQMVGGMRQVQAETLIICGKNDMVFASWVALRMIHMIERAWAQIYDGCGHFPWIEQKRRTLRDIRAFIKERS